MNPTNDGFSLVVPTYNRQRLLSQTLQSIGRMKFPAAGSFELIVINNNCTDSTADVVARAAANSKLPTRMVMETRQGLCHCRNRALAEAKFDHVIFLDDDIQNSPSWIDGYCDAIARFGAACVVGPVFAIFECKPPAYCTQAVLDSVCSTYSRKGPRAMRLPRDVAHELPGCNFGVRKSVALELGGFDPRLDRNGGNLLAGGDFEFGLRLVRAGHVVAYHPRCWIEHIITPEKLSRDYLRRRWYGVGVTQRALSHEFGLPRRIRATLGICRLGLSAIKQQLTDDSAAAFESQLRAIKSFGYLRRASSLTDSHRYE